MRLVGGRAVPIAESPVAARPIPRRSSPRGVAFWIALAGLLLADSGVIPSPYFMPTQIGREARRAQVSPARRSSSVPPPPGPSAAFSSTPVKPSAAPKPAKAPPPAPELGREAKAPEARRIRIRDRSGGTVIGRVYGGSGDNLHVMLPDGQLGNVEGHAFTDEPFAPASPRAVATQLLDGPFGGYKLKMTPHYVIAYKSSDRFAEASAQVLEDLYKSLLEAFKKRDFPVHEAEFPLVAVIFKDEKDFRAYRPIDPQIRAYFEIYTNRIHFYETSPSDEAAPEVAAIRRPQTVAHEGTHQILSNIGIHPRLAAWPPWLIEGLAEYCATPVTTKKGTNWSILGAVNSQHVATIRDLSDPISLQANGPRQPVHIGRSPDEPLVEYLVKKTDLTPTDYALSWAVTHYLGMKRVDAFVNFLKTMSRMPPLEKRSPEDQLAAFRAAFGPDLQKLDRDIDKYLSKLKVGNPLPFYTVVFQQRIPGNLVKRAAMVSQSPSMIRQWIDTMTARAGDPPVWNAIAYKTRSPALAAAEAFVRGE